LLETARDEAAQVISDARASSAIDSARLRDATEQELELKARQVLDAATEESRRILERASAEARAIRDEADAVAAAAAIAAATASRPSVPEPAKSPDIPPAPTPAPASAPQQKPLGADDTAMSSTESPRTTRDDPDTVRWRAEGNVTTSAVAVAPAEAKPTNGVLANGTKNGAGPKNAATSAATTSSKAATDAPASAAAPSPTAAASPAARTPKAKRRWRIFGRAG
jgi:hypothetical protein